MFSQRESVALLWRYFGAFHLACRYISVGARARLRRFSVNTLRSRAPTSSSVRFLCFAFSRVPPPSFGPFPFSRPYLSFAASSVVLGPAFILPACFCVPAPVSFWRSFVWVLLCFRCTCFCGLFCLGFFPLYLPFPTCFLFLWSSRVSSAVNSCFRGSLCLAFVWVGVRLDL